MVNKIMVETEEMLNELYNTSALTMEGLVTDDENLSAFVDWVDEICPMQNRNVYIIKGRTMNDTYGLTGNNQYDPELNIVSIMFKDMVDNGRSGMSKLAVRRFDVGLRWFDDIVDNNVRRN